MTIKNREDRPSSDKLEIDLTGPDGNAYVLFGIAENLAKQLGKNPESIIENMRSSDYEHLVQVLDDEFGDYIILWR